MLGYVWKYVCLCLIITFMWLHPTKNFIVPDDLLSAYVSQDNFFIYDQHICLVLPDKAFIYMSGYAR